MLQVTTAHLHVCGVLGITFVILSWSMHCRTVRWSESTHALLHPICNSLR